MLAPALELERRRPVWQAMSELFLDQEHDEETFSQIARVCAESGYTDQELERIFAEEVAPQVYWNLYAVAGECWFFPIEWLERQVLAGRGVGYWIDRLLLMRLAMRMVRDDWRRTKERLSDARRRTISQEGGLVSAIHGGCLADEPPSPVR